MEQEMEGIQKHWAARMSQLGAESSLLFESREDRDAALKSGMECGIAAGLQPPRRFTAKHRNKRDNIMNGHTAC